MVDILIVMLSVMGALALSLMADVLFNNNYELLKDLFGDEEEL